MFLRLFGISAPAVIGGLWFVGAFAAPAYDETVPQPPDVVAVQLAGLEIDSLGDGGGEFSSLPPVRTEELADGWRWTMDGPNGPSLTFTATLRPDGGGTRVTGTVDRGDLSGIDSPALKTPGMMETLFAQVLEARLAPRDTPAGRTAAEEAERRAAMASGMMTAARIAADPDAVKRDMGRMNALFAGDPPEREPDGGGWGE